MARFCVRRPIGDTYIGRMGTLASANGTLASVKWDTYIGQMGQLHRSNGTPAAVTENGYTNPLTRETVGVVER